jgi:hypothetical protein
METSKPHVLKKQNNAPKKAPAWKALVMLLDTELAFFAVMPKSFLKPAREMVVPTNAES